MTGNSGSFSPISSARALGDVLPSPTPPTEAKPLARESRNHDVRCTSLILAALGVGAAASDLCATRRVVLVRTAYRRSVKASLGNGGQAGAKIYFASDRRT